LAGSVEATHVTDFGNERHGDDEGDAPHRLIGGNHRRHRPSWHDAMKLLIKALQPAGAILDRVDRLLQHDLLRRMLERLVGQPARMRVRPVLGTAIEAAVTQQTSAAVLARARTRSRTASCTASGTHTAVSSPARNSRARLTASRRLVFTRSPGFLGISDGATTVHS
jgi:hypothetical protein